MITQTHDQLDNWVAVLTLVTTAWGGISAFRTYTTRGWKEARRLKEQQMHSTIMELLESKGTQFRRIDEIQRDVDNCVKREVYDQLQKEIALKFDTVVSNLSQQIREGFASINTRIDRLTDGRHL